MPNHDFKVLRSEGRRFYKALVNISILSIYVPAYSIFSHSNQFLRMSAFSRWFHAPLSNIKFGKILKKDQQNWHFFLKKFRNKSIFLPSYGCIWVDNSTYVNYRHFGVVSDELAPDLTIFRSFFQKISKNLWNFAILGHITNIKPKN